MANVKDQLPNLAALSLTESAANTLTFFQLLTGVSLASGVGILIDRLDWFNKDPIEKMNSTGDAVYMGLASSNALTAISVVDRRILTLKQKSRLDMGTAAVSMILDNPDVQLFDPPLIFAGPALYAYILGSGLSAASNVLLRMYFRYVELTTQEYLELAEQFILLG